MSKVATSIPVTFTAPMPGFEGVHDFALRSVDGAPGLFALDIGQPPMRLFLADSAVFAPSYSPSLPAAAIDPLELESGGSTMVLLVVTPSPGSTTVNLMAPIVFNPDNGRCTQVVLDSRDYPLRAEIASL